MKFHADHMASNLWASNRMMVISDVNIMEKSF